jgi:class 3 adenylate cyclase/tetratricopeptide (TPR) repeat protein
MGTVTFLFTDIEGSTRLLKELGRDRYGDVLAAHNRLLRTAFTDCGGIEVGTKGDSFFVVFRSAGAAVRAVAAGQRALASHEWPEGVTVRVRMGLHTGEASLGSDGYIGLAVHQASRIGDAGHGGQVLLSSATANLVWSELPADVRLRDLGPTALRDFDLPERLFQLDVAGLPADFPPLDTRDQKKVRAPRRRIEVQVGTTPLLEREAEVAAMEAVAESAAAGGGRMIAIEGRPGAGKTRLASEARSLADAAGFEVLAARSAELEQEFAYGVVRQLFEPFLASLPNGDRDDLLSGTAALAQRLFDDEELTGATPADVPFAVLNGLYRLATNLAQRRPLALVVDDLHWADAPTLRWLQFLSRRLEGLRLLVVISTRPPEQSVERELLTELVSDPDALVIRPGALSRSAVAAIVEQEFGAAADPEFVAACHAATGGNPLFARALVSALHGEGVTPVAANAGRVREIGPQPVNRAVSLRLSRLPEESRRFATAAAVLGDGADNSDVAALAGIDDRDLASLAATSLARVDLLRVTAPTVEFAHPVVRASIYGAMEPAERLAAHRRAAEILDAARAEPERVAAHLDLLPPAADPFAVETLRIAADRALVRGAPDVAVRYLRRALAEPPSPEARAETLRELGLAERRVDVGAAAEHLQEALLAADPEDRPRYARLALELGRSLFRLNRGPEAVRVLEDAIERLDGAEPELGEMIEAELINSAGFDSDVYDVSKGRLAKIGDRELTAEPGHAVMLATVRYFEARRGENREAVARLADAATLDELNELVPSMAIACAASALMYAEYDAELDRFFDVMMDAARKRGELVTLSSLLTFRGLTVAQRGDLNAAIADLREASEVVPYVPSQQSVLYYSSYIADVLTNRGELEEAEASLAALNLPEEVDESGHMVFFLGARGWLRFARRDFAGAASDWERLGRCMEAFDMCNPALLAWRSHLALALLGLGRRERALELAREEVELAKAWGAPRAIGVALRTKGLAEGGSEGIETLRESLEVLRGSSAKLERARTMVELGAALQREGKVDEARELLNEGLRIAAESGSQPLVERCEHELGAGVA